MDIIDVAQLTILIRSSIEGKYGEIPETHIRELVQRAEKQLRQARTEDDFLRGAAPTIDLETDIFNQVRAYSLIERIWRVSPPKDRYVERLHSAVYGLRLEEIVFRESAFVQDYGDEVPTHIQDIPDRLIELNRTIASADALIFCPLHEQARYLATLFAGIIRVHPFRDGNGRTARMTMQYCVRRWGHNYIVVPKVKNDASWKHVLSRAIEGDYDGLIGFFSLCL